LPAARCAGASPPLLGVWNNFRAARQIKTQRIAAEQAMEQFSRIIRHLLSIVPQLNDSIDDPQIAGRLVALYSFMQGKSWWAGARAGGDWALPSGI
jgi:hypothetical protein